MNRRALPDILSIIPASAIKSDLLRFNGMTTLWVEVSPELARTLLKYHEDDGSGESNRPLRQRVVDEYAQAIIQNRWITHHQGAAFDWYNRGIDAQHRLAGIVKAGKPVLMLITTGLNPEAKFAVDMGMKRTLTDMAHYTAAELESPGIWTAAINHARKCVYKDTRRMTGSDLIALIDHFKEGIDFLVSNPVHGGRFKCAPFLGAIVYCYKKHPDEVKRIYEEICSLGFSLKRASRPIDTSDPIHRAWLALVGDNSTLNLFERIVTAIYLSLQGFTVNKQLQGKPVAVQYFLDAYPRWT